jgi:hypothetical protein
VYVRKVTVNIMLHALKAKVAEAHTCFKSGVFYASLHGSSITHVSIHPVQLVCPFLLILRNNTRSCLSVSVLQRMGILPTDVLHSWVPISEVSREHSHKSMVRDNISSSLVIDLHSPSHWRRWHFHSSCIMWWRRGLLSSIGFLLFIIFNLNDLRIFFRFGFFLGWCWHLDGCFRGLLLLLRCFLLWLFRCKQNMRWVVSSSGDAGSLTTTNHLQSFLDVVRIEAKFCNKIRHKKHKNLSNNKSKIISIKIAKKNILNRPFLARLVSYSQQKL